jgi:DNA-binding HxlR family transcriptional regulator
VVPSAGLQPVRSRCPIASALDLLGDKWTLVVVRDLLLLGKHRFADLLASGEGISTNVLAERLERLEWAGLVERRRYQEHPPRDEYHLTESGRELFPVLRELIQWAGRHIPGTFRPPAGWLESIEPKLRGPREG